MTDSKGVLFLPSRASSAQSSFYPSRDSSAHDAKLLMSMALPDTWETEAGADVEVDEEEEYDDDDDGQYFGRMARHDSGND